MHCAILMLRDKIPSMFKYTVLRLALIVMCYGAMPVTLAQENRKAFNKREFTISAGYGIGNIWKKFLRDAISNPDQYKVSATGPFVLLVDYNLFKRINVGVAGGYSETYGSYSGSSQSFKETLSAFSLLARANWHFGNWERWDIYAGGGAGYYHFKYSNNRNIIKPNSVPGSFGYSLQIGGSWYFVPRWGVYAEIGYVGGSLAQAGLKRAF